MNPDDMDDLLSGDFYGNDSLYDFYGIYDNWA
jgi:hypothetical protein